MSSWARGSALHLKRLYRSCCGPVHTFQASAGAPCEFSARQLTIWLRMPISIPSGRLPFTRFLSSVLFSGANIFTTAPGSFVPILECRVSHRCKSMFSLVVSLCTFGTSSMLRQAGRRRSSASRRSGWSNKLPIMSADIRYSKSQVYSRSMSRRILTSSLVTKLMATPLRPNLPDRPMRWM